MSDYIEREAVKDEILSWAVCINHPNLLSKEDVLYCIDSLPAADVAPVRHGRWVPLPHTGDCCYSCSECGFLRDAYMLDEDNYCPHCGALMDGKEDNT